MSMGPKDIFEGVSVLFKAVGRDTACDAAFFLVAGFGVACWSPLVPFAKEKLHVDDGTLGLLLLCLGVGSVALMFLTGVLNARYGSRPITLRVASDLRSCSVLAVAGSPVSLGMTLFGFGAALGSLDVAMNIHAVEVEHAAGKPLMSGFHALFTSEVSSVRP